MIIPFFIPMFDNDDDCDCHSVSFSFSLPKQFYKYRYAVPKSFFLKNKIIKIISYIIFIIGLFICSLPMIFINYTIEYVWPLSIMIIGLLMSTYSYYFYKKYIKSPDKCKDKIYLEIEDSFLNPENWEDKLKNTIIPENYKLTKEESSFRFILK